MWYFLGLFEDEGNVRVDQTEIFYTSALWKDSASSETGIQNKVLCVGCRWTRRSWRTMRSIRRRAGLNFSSTKPPGAQVRVFQTKETQNKLMSMKLSVRILLCLFCGASAAAQQLDWSPEPDQRPDQPEVQEPAGRPDPQHRNHCNTYLLNIWWKLITSCQMSFIVCCFSADFLHQSID